MPRTTADAPPEEKQFIASMMAASAQAMRRAAESADGAAALAAIARACADALRAGKKILVCGNGGSAADSQHIATELVVRLRKEPERRALAAIALTTDTSLLTACSNDFSFEQIFSRQVEALGAAGDVLIGISTSGNSPNVIRAFEAGKRQGLTCILFGGGAGGKLLPVADLAYLAPADSTSNIQEVQLASYHAFLHSVERQLLGWT